MLRYGAEQSGGYEEEQESGRSSLWQDSSRLLNLDVYEILFSVQKTKETRVIKHFWFDSWPDHGVPNSTDACVDLVHVGFRI